MSTISTIKNVELFWSNLYWQFWPRIFCKRGDGYGLIEIDHFDHRTSIWPNLTSPTPNYSMDFHSELEYLLTVPTLYWKQLAGSPSSGWKICVNWAIHLSFNPHLTISTNHPVFNPLPLPLRDLTIVFFLIQKSTSFLSHSSSLVIRLYCSHPTRVTCPYPSRGSVFLTCNR
jgi:hypothetical protein